MQNDALIIIRKASGGYDVGMAAPAGPWTGVLSSTVPVWLHLGLAMATAAWLGQGCRGSLAALAYAVAASVYMSWGQGQVRAVVEPVYCSCGPLSLCLAETRFSLCCPCRMPWDNRSSY